MKLPAADTLLPAQPDPGAGDTPLARLCRRPHSFDFHQAVRLIDGWLANLPPDRRPVLRFCNSLSLGFPASEIEALELEAGRDTEGVDDGEGAAGRGAGPDAEDGSDRARGGLGPRRLALTPSFMGLLGAGGALPTAYSEQLAAHEGRHRDAAARAFLDIFQHRAVALFHAAWRKHRLVLEADAPSRDRTQTLLLSLGGLCQPGLRGRLDAAGGGVADTTLAHYAGLLQRRGASAAQLQAVLADYLGVPVRIEQLVGRWCALDAGNLNRIGQANATLGSDAVLSERVWQRQLRLRLVLGPLSAAQLRRFLPRQPGQRALEGLLALVAGVSLEWEIRLRLRADAVAPSRLAGAGEPIGSGLGWNSFLLAQASPTEREESVYQLVVPGA